MATLIQNPLATSQDPVIKTYGVLSVVAPRVLVYFCRDPKIKNAVELFLKQEREFKLEECVLMSEFGGVLYGAEHSRLPFENFTFSNQLKFALQIFPTIDMVVGINHEGCGRYAAAHAAWGNSFLGGSGYTMVDRQKRDLAVFSDAVRQVIAPRSISIRVFHMNFANQERTRVSFEEV